MRRVPRVTNSPNYLIIGAGFVARHFSYYLSLLNIPYAKWSRKSKRPLAEFLRENQRVVCLLADDVIEDFIKAHHFPSNTIIHFSGQLRTPLAISAHPLMTFHEQPYSLTTYCKIPFILEKNTARFSDLFPELKNPAIYLSPQDKAKYHSLCVMAGNFSHLLWQKMASEFSQMGLQAHHYLPYLEQTLDNFRDNPNSLTGPLVRDDQKTLAANLQALAGDPFQIVYQAFINAYNQERYDAKHQ